jgi:hypothetical protein
MKKGIIGLLVATCCISAFGQFFSKEETATNRDEKIVELKTSLPEADQQIVYLELCAEMDKAEAKANQLHSVKIHHTPEQRAAQQKKAAKAKATLLKHYKEGLAKKHGITEDCLSEIEATGNKKGWAKTKKALASE